MSLLSKKNIRFTIIFISVLCNHLLFTISCNSSANTDKKTSDSLVILKLPAAGNVSVVERERIKNACELWYDTVLKTKGFNGGMIVAKEGNIIFEKYTGTGHLPGKDTITANSPMHIASISKTFTAMAVLKLQQDGKLNIDEEFSKYFPQFNYPGVTIRNLLSHRSGLPNYTHFLENLKWDKNRFITNAELLDFLITRKTELTDIIPPNTHFSYCNTNFALLALLIEKVTGIKYADYLNNTFFKPLQMKNTYVFTLADTLKAMPSYNWKGIPEGYTFLDQVYGDKNIYTTPVDLLTWDRALSSNIIFTNETLEQAYAPYSNEKPGIRNYGLGWRMNIFPEGHKIIYHNGWWHGSNAAFIRLLNEKATIIVIGNKFTRSIYDARILTSIFGEYYKQDEEEEPGLLKDSLSVFDSRIVTNTDRLTPLKTKKNLSKKKSKQ
ncbi:MAG: serine hydrolase domain-containing protein [Ferruginibacter sp.]